MAKQSDTRFTHNRLGSFVHYLGTNPISLIGLIGMVLILVLAVLGPFLTPFPYDEMSSHRLKPPDWVHWMGTDNFGRDMFSRFLSGTRISVFVGVGSVAFGLIVGACVGMLAGIKSGTWWDTIIMRGVDVIMAFPLLVIVPVLSGIMEMQGITIGPFRISNMTVVGLAIGVVLIPVFARVARSEVLSEMRQDYIVAARSFGVKTRDLLFSNLLPNIQAPLIVQAAFSIAIAIMIEAAVSFLGLGVQPPHSSWGTLLSDGRRFILLGGWWLVLFPAIAIAVAVLSFNLIGDALRDVLDPRAALKRRKSQERKAQAILEQLRTRPAPPPAAGEEADLLSVRGLTTLFPVAEGLAPAVNQVSFDLKAGESVGLVGESGSGKSTILKSILRLIQKPGEITGSIYFKERDLMTLSEEEMRSVRGGEIGMIFQDPVNTLNPSFTIGTQLRRGLKLHQDQISESDLDPTVIDMLKKVGIDARQKLNSYPFQFSQGQIQRIMIAAASLSGNPSLLMADEPTTSLDVTIEAQVLQLMRDLVRELRLTLLLVTHNLAIVAELCDRVLVMYAGVIVEDADVYTLFKAPSHPYTRQLLHSIPQFPSTGERLIGIEGSVPPLGVGQQGCPFAARCAEYIGEICDRETPTLRLAGRMNQLAACHLYRA